MKITTITVSSGRKIPHPAIDFANLNSYISITAELDDADQISSASIAERLQKAADAIVEVHVEDLRERHTPKARAEKATADTAAKLAAKHGAK